jgi:hypothetical protein
MLGIHSARWTMPDDDLLTVEDEIMEIGGFEVEPAEPETTLTPEEIAFLEEFEEKYGDET